MIVSDQSQGKLFQDVLSELRASGHELCVSHGYDDYPEHIKSDVDAVCEDPRLIYRALSEGNAAAVVQVSRNVPDYFYVLCRRSSARPTFLHLHVSTGSLYRGRTFLTAKDFLETSRLFRSFVVPSPEVEFAGYLVRKLVKGSLSNEQTRKLSELYAEAPAECDRRLARLLPKAEADLVARAAREGDWEPVYRQADRLKRVLLSRASKGQRMRVLRHGLETLLRRLRFIIRPRGLMVGLLGPDGSGKSTVAARLEQDLGPAFAGTKLYQRRPMSSPRRRLPARYHPYSDYTAPHRVPPRGLVPSLAKLVVWWGDYLLLGYLGDIFPRLVRNNLVILDRCYNDLLGDPKRYRYGGPLWAARFVGRFVPRPHLVILLDAPPEVIQARKQEVTFEESVLGREAYLRVVEALPNGHVVDSSKPLDEVVAEVEAIILDYMEKRVSRRAPG
jgi:thymidylate kinase